MLLGSSEIHWGWKRDKGGAVHAPSVQAAAPEGSWGSKRHGDVKELGEGPGEPRAVAARGSDGCFLLKE